MIHALGYSVDEINPADPGRLCRGRERWIEPWEEGASLPRLHRLVISGAAFSDDSARDAQRGLSFSKLDAAAVITALFPRRALLAFMEDGHGADIPEGAEGIEAYPAYRAGGAQEEPLVRWYKRVSGVREIRQLLSAESADGSHDVIGLERVRGLLVLGGEENIEELWEKVFLLVGMSTLDSPPARYQPAAMPEILEMAKAVILLHRDKHGPALGIYSVEPVKMEGKLDAMCEKEGVLMVPFAIPPMLARWDRALHDLRTNWMAKHDAEFPVPPAPEPSGWEPRRRRRRRGEPEFESSPLELPVVAESEGEGEE